MVNDIKDNNTLTRNLRSWAPNADVIGPFEKVSLYVKNAKTRFSILTIKGALDKVIDMVY